jgi:hypothetical protein
VNEYLRDRILRKLETLSDERMYQVLDYVEFMESKYAERQQSSASIFTRFTDTVEDGLRAGRVPAAAIADAMGLMSKAMGVLGGVAAAGKSVANDIVGSARPAGPGASSPTPSPSTAEPPRPPGAAPQPPGETRS